MKEYVGLHAKRHLRTIQRCQEKIPKVACAERKEDPKSQYRIPELLIMPDFGGLLFGVPGTM